MKDLALNLIVALAFPLMLAAGPASAQPPAGERPPHRRPPPEAFAACQDKKADDACEVTLHEHKLTGKCAAMPDGPLACRPDHPPRRPDGEQKQP
jgi:hypothetical protein